MGKNRDGLIKFLIKGFIAMGVIMLLYLTLYTFFYDSRMYILNLYKITDWLLIKGKLKFTDNFYVNVFSIYLILLTVIYIVGEKVMSLGKKDKVKSKKLRVVKGKNVSKNGIRKVKNQH